MSPAVHGFVTLVCTDKGRHRRTVLAELDADGSVLRGAMAPRRDELDHLDDDVQHLACPRCPYRGRVDVRRLVAGLHDALETRRGEPGSNPFRYGDLDVRALRF